MDTEGLVENDEAGAQTSSKRAKTCKQEAARGIWLITYTAASDDITPEMLHSYSVICNECYTIQWRESKYTLIKTIRSKRVRQSAMEKVMFNLHDRYKIQGTSIVGYETLSCNTKTESSVEEHPGFKRIIEILNTKREDIKIWMEVGDVTSNKKGLLWKYLGGKDQKAKTRKELLQQIETWEPVIQNSSNIKTENDVLRSTLEIRENELIEANKVIVLLKSRNEKLFKDLMDKMEECTALKQRLI